MRDKLRIFQFGQYIVGNVVFLAFWWHSQVQNRNGGCEEMYKNVNTISDRIFPHTPVTPQHAGVIDDVIIIGRRRVYCTITLLGRCLCKCVDVYIITLSCTWRIYALSEHLLVLCLFSSQKWCCDATRFRGSVRYHLAVANSSWVCVTVGHGKNAPKMLVISGLVGRMVVC